MHVITTALNNQPIPEELPMPIPSELAIWLQTETPAIRELAYIRPDKEEYRLKLNNTKESGYFIERLRLLKQSDRLLGRTIHEAQAEVAHLHGLSYLKLGNESRWVTSDDPRLSAEQRKLILPAGKQEQDVLIGGRSKNYFDLNRPTGFNSLPKVDVGLLESTKKWGVSSQVGRFGYRLMK